MDTGTGRSGTAEPSLTAGFADASTVLLLVPPDDPAADWGCSDLSRLDPPETEDVLAVTLDRSPDQRLLDWRRDVSAQPPAKMGILSVDDTVRSASGTVGSIRHPIETLSLATVPSTADLAGIGITVSDYLSEWHDDGNLTVVCFDSISPIVAETDPEQAFRFLHTLTTQLRRLGAVGHFHMDPGAHDEPTIKTLRPLFDAVVELKDGTFHISRR